MELRKDRHTVSMLTDHLVFSPKYRGKMLVGEVALRTEEIITEICDELGVDIIEMGVNVDHVHIFYSYPPKHSVSYIAQIIKRESSIALRREFPHLKIWCKEHLWAPSCFHGSVGQGFDVVERYITSQKQYHLKEGK